MIELFCFVEVEWKFDVDDSILLLDWVGIFGVDMVIVGEVCILDVWYFDIVDGEFVCVGVVLCWCFGGFDEGWYVKGL